MSQIIPLVNTQFAWAMEQLMFLFPWRYIWLPLLYFTSNEISPMEAVLYMIVMKMCMIFQVGAIYIWSYVYVIMKISAEKSNRVERLDTHHSVVTIRSSVATSDSKEPLLLSKVKWCSLYLNSEGQYYPLIVLLM